MTFRRQRPPPAWEDMHLERPQCVEMTGFFSIRQEFSTGLEDFLPGPARPAPAKKPPAGWRRRLRRIRPTLSSTPLRMSSLRVRARLSLYRRDIRWRPPGRPALTTPQSSPLCRTRSLDAGKRRGQRPRAFRAGIGPGSGRRIRFCTLLAVRPLQGMSRPVRHLATSLPCRRTALSGAASREDGESMSAGFRERC
jgi:hypothetical protein